MKNATFLLLLLFQKVYYCIFPHFKIFSPPNSTHLYFSLESPPAKIKAEESPLAKIKAEKSLSARIKAVFVTLK